MSDPLVDALRGRELAVVLVISGVTDRYYCGPAPDVEPIPGTTGLDNRDVCALLSLGAESATVDDIRSKVSQAPVTVRLAARDAPVSAATRTAATHSIDPVSTLRRIGPRGATGTKLAGTVPHEAGPTDVDVVDDVSAWSGLVHCGLEAMQPTATIGTQLQGCARGVADTRIARHLYQPTRGAQPTVTRDVTYWRGRPAIVRAAPVVDGVRVGAYVEIWRGVLDREPELSGDGMTLTVKIAAMSAAMRQRLSAGATSTKLLRGWHYFTPGRASDVRIRQVWPVGAAYRGVADVVAVDAQLTSDTYDAHVAQSDITLPAGHPRSGAVLLSGTRYETTARLPGLELDLDPNPPVGSYRLRNPELAEDARLSLIDDSGPQVVAWPERLLVAIAGADPTLAAYNLATHRLDRWIVNTTQGDAGRWASVSMAQGVQGWEFRAGLVEEPQADSELTLRWVPSPADICVGLDYRGPDDAAHFIDLEAGSVAIRNERITGEATLGALTALPCRGPALAWYQSAEPYILVEEDIWSAGGPMSVRISGGDDLNYSTGSFDIEISGSSVVLDPDTGDPIGYALAVSAVSDPSLYALDHGTPVTVTPQARSYGTPPTELLLRLMESGVGNGVNGVWDVYPYGANLDQSDIFEPSFFTFAIPSALEGATFDIDSTQTVEDSLGDVLTLLGGAVVQRYLDGRQKLALVSLSPASDAAPVMVVQDADILADGQVTSAVDGQVVRGYKISTNYDGSGKPTRVTTFIDSDAVDAAGGDGGEQLALDMRGINVDGGPLEAVAALLPVIQHMRRRVGVPRVRYQLAISIDHPNALEVAVGDAVTLTSSSAVRIDGTLGLVSEPCRVMGLERDWSGGRLGLTLQSTGLRPAGWVPSLEVLSVVSPVKVQVEPNAYTSTIDPATGETQTDLARTSLNYFSAGDRVRCIPAGDWGAGVERDIVGIVGDVVELSAAHGLVAGDALDHASYDDATSTTRRYAYLSDAAHTLGAANERGKDVG